MTCGHPLATHGGVLPPFWSFWSFWSFSIRRSARFSFLSRFSFEVSADLDLPVRRPHRRFVANAARSARLDSV
jgi:hypothetical protein